jgi:mannose-6-phosphate isomerase
MDNEHANQPIANAALQQRVERPWGWFEDLGGGPGYKVKRLCIHAGQRISLQRHRHRQEHWVVVAGSGALECAGRRLAAVAGTTLLVPCGAVHRATAAGDDLLIVEVQRGDWLSEDDIERLADDFGRVGNDVGAEC